MISPKIIATLDEVLHSECLTAKIPGMALVIAKNGQPIFEKYYGYRDVNRELPVTKDTIFGAASIPKSLTAFALLQLEDAGKLSVDDQVILWLPEFYLPNEQYREKLKIHHLLSHTSGLPGMNIVNCARANSILNDPHGEDLFDCSALGSDYIKIKTVQELMDVMGELDYTLLGRPGTLFNYSNEGYALLQEIIERASGETFITYVQKNIFQPLEMKHSFFLTSDLENMENVTELYAYRKESDHLAVFHSPAWWDVGDIFSNGSLKTSSSDLMKYLEVFRLDGTVNGKTIISKKSIQKMTSIQATMPTGASYGYGLQVDCLSGISVFDHGGSIKGVSSHMKVAKEQGITISVLTNIADANVEKMTITSLNYILQLPDVTRMEFTEYKLSEEVVNNFVGKYQSDEGQKAEILLVDNRIQLKLQNKLFLMKAYTEDGFMTSEGDKIKFIMDDQAKVKGLFNGSRFIPKRN